MKKTKAYDGVATRLAVSDNDLAIMMGCGEVTAKEIARRANARFRVGRRVLNNLKLIQAYIDSISDGE